MPAGEVDDRQPAHPQAGLARQEHAVVVGATVPDGVQEPCDRLGRDRASRVAVDKAYDAAHFSVSARKSMKDLKFKRWRPHNSNRANPRVSAPERVIRVLHLLAPAREGGQETVVRLLGRGMKSAADLEAGVLVLNQIGGEHPFASAARADGLDVREVRSGARHYLREARDVAAMAREGGWNLLHTHGYHADLVGRLAARRARVPVIATAHGTTGGGWKNRLYEKLQWWAWRGFDRVIAVSAPLAARMEASGIDSARVVMIRNAFEAGPSLTRAQARERLGVPAEGQRVGWVGRLDVEKGPDVMIDALAELRRKDVSLSMIGRGPMEPALREQARTRGIDAQVSWHNAVRGAAELMPAFDLFAMSSRTEGTPMVLFEAMSAEVPVVTTSVGGVPDVVTAKEALLVSAERPADLASAMAAALDDAPASRARAASARARLARDFGLAPWIERHRRLYDDVLQSHEQSR
ncbi:MAG TPA: glycosyltransferase [Gemmatimonadales bacterium]|jgi:glycosyltransferase involved in cell wall biosynthesis